MIYATQWNFKLNVLNAANCIGSIQFVLNQIKHSIFQQNVVFLMQIKTNSTST